MGSEETQGDLKTLAHCEMKRDLPGGGNQHCMILSFNGLNVTNSHLYVKVRTPALSVDPEKGRMHVRVAQSQHLFLLCVTAGQELHVRLCDCATALTLTFFFFLPCMAEAGLHSMPAAHPCVTS